jgi:hypothetical protein
LHEHVACLDAVQSIADPHRNALGGCLKAHPDFASMKAEYHRLQVEVRHSGLWLRHDHLGYSYTATSAPRTWGPDGTAAWPELLPSDHLCRRRRKAALGARRYDDGTWRSGLHDPQQATNREDIVAPAAQSLAVMPTMEATMEAIMEATMEAIVEVKAAVVAEVVEMMEPFEPRSAAIKCLGPNIVSVARPIGVIPATCFGARSERSHQDH